MKTCTLITTLFLLSNTLIFSQPGSLDSSFSKDGKVRSFIDDGSGEGSSANAAALAQDGKLIVAGPANDNYVLAKYKPNGALDKSFGVNGAVISKFQDNINSYISAVATQADGKIIIAGHTNYGSDANVALARYNANGSIDSSFGTNGKVIIDFINGDYDAASGLAIQPNGKIIVSVVALTVTNYNFAALRLKPNGRPDNSFGTNGKVITDFSAATDEYSNAVALQPDGKIILAGTISGESLQDFVLARYMPDGSPDNNFGVNGKVTTDFNSLDDGAAVAVKPDGKIVVTGDTYNGSNYDFAIAQYKVNGTPDLNFGVNGKVTTEFSAGSSEVASSIAIQADGKIIVGGGSNSIFALARYKRNGTLDPGFGNGGKQTTDFFDTECYGKSVLLQPDGKIILAGYTFKYNFPDPSAKNWIAIARYKGDAAVFSENSDRMPSDIASQNLAGNAIMYPNPVQSVLNIEFKNAGTSQIVISIYNTNGKSVISKYVQGNTQLDLKQLPAGTYLIKINDENGKELYSGKVIKQ